MRRFNYFVAIAAALTIGLSGCSKKSDDTPARDIAKEYSGTNFKATNAGETIPGGSVKIEAIDDNNAKLTLVNIVNGQAMFEMNAHVIQTRAAYSFTGSKDIDGMKVLVEGTVVDGVAAVNVAVEMLGTDILKAWTFNATLGEDGEPDADFFVFNLENKSGEAAWAGNVIPVAEFGENLKMWVQMIAGLALRDCSLTFDKNGYIGFSATVGMTEEDSQQITMDKLARYYYNPKTNLLVFDAAGESLQALGGNLKVPFDCTITNNVLTATIQPAFIALMKPMIPKGAELEELLKGLDALLPPNFAYFGDIIKTMITDIVNAITDEGVTELTVGAKLMPAPAAAE